MKLKMPPLSVEEIRLGLGVICNYAFIYIKICNLLMIKDNVKMNQLHPDSYRDCKDIRVKLQTSPSLNRHFRAAEENLRLVEVGLPTVFMICQKNN